MCSGWIYWLMQVGGWGGMAFLNIAALAQVGKTSTAMVTGFLVASAMALLGTHVLNRVMRRRGVDTVRLKKVIDSEVLEVDGKRCLWEVRTSSGTYIKELISGDGGRTQPSVASLAGVPCICASLDVTGVHSTPGWERRAR